MAKSKAVQGAAPVAAEEAAVAEQDVSSGNGAVIDLSGVNEDAGFPITPRGIYPAVVDDLTYGLSQSSGNPMWTWRFEISDGEFAGRKFFFHTPFVENMMPRVKKTLARIGATELLNGPFNAEEIANNGSLIGKACRIRLDVKPYEGKPRNNVRDVLAADDSAGSESFLGPEGQ